MNRGGLSFTSSSFTEIEAESMWRGSFQAPGPCRGVEGRGKRRGSGRGRVKEGIARKWMEGKEKRTGGKMNKLG